MNFRKFALPLAILALTVSAGPLRSAEPVGYLDLDDLKFAILKAIRDTQAEYQDQEPYFLITNVTLDIKGTEIEGAEGALKIPIFASSASAEAIAEYTNSHSLKLELSPDTPIATRAVPDIQLSHMVGAVKAAFHGEAVEEEPAQDPERPADDDAATDEGVSAGGTTEADAQDDSVAGLSFSPDRMTYTYSGVLKEKLGGGFDFVFFKIGGRIEQQSLQVITFDLCRTETRVNCVE